MYHQLLEYVLPPYCKRGETPLALFLYPPVILVAQAALLLHTPAQCTGWIWRNHAQAIRAILLLPLLVLTMRMAFAHFRPERLLPGGDVFPVKANMDNFVFGVMGSVMIGKGIEFAWLRESPRLSFSDPKESRQEANQESDVIHRRPPQPLLFPHTWVPLCVDLVFNFHGYGWEWGSRKDSPAGYATRSPPTSHFDPRSIRWLKSRLSALMLFFVLYCANVFIVAQPRTLAAFDFPPGSESFQAEPYSRSRTTTALARGVLALITGGLGICATMQGYYCLASLFHFVLDPRAQIYWDTRPFGNPLRSTSLHRAWGREWHSIMRRVWYFNGYKPVYHVAHHVVGFNNKVSQTLAIFALFGLSGLFHEIGMHNMRQGVLDGVPRSPDSPCPPLHPLRQGFGANSFITLKFFLVQALGLLLEDIWRKVTGRRVCGKLGWLWTMAWFIYWGAGVYKTWVDHAFFEPFMGYPNAYAYPKLFALTNLTMTPLFKAFDYLGTVLP